jgi:hypothetical protein
MITWQDSMSALEPDEVLLDKLPDLRLTNASIKKTIEKYAKNMPSKEEAYNFAIQMEKSLSEAFFQELFQAPW